MSTESDRWAARRATWRVERLDPARARATERRDRFVTLGDIPLEGLYGPWSLQETPDGGPAGGGGPTALDRGGEPLAGGRWDDFDAARDIGLPGEAPFTRGIHPTGYRSRLWTMRMFARFRAPHDTNPRFPPLP